MRFRFILSGLFLLLLRPAAGAEILHSGDTVAICGDSITEQRIYSVYLETYLLACQPVAGVSAHQFGWSGESAPGLAKRIPYGVLPFQPTVATLLYGMNDGGYVSTDPRRIASLEESTDSIVAQLQAGGARRVLVGTPGVVDTEKFKAWRLAKCTPDEYNQTLFDLGQAAKRVAEKRGAIWVDVHGEMLRAMAKAKTKYGADYLFAHDGVHPSFNGHLVMAYAFLRALGCEGDIGTLTLDAQTGRGTASAGHRILAGSPGSLEVESARYPFCFTDDPANPESSRAVLDCVPFNEDLNRFRLIVTHAPAARLQLQWGRASKSFTADQLATGINLAAEFPDNPFNEAFATIETAVRAQQAFETPAVKTLLNGLPAWRQALPDEAAIFDQLAGKLVTRSRALAGDARAALRPIRHSLVITAAP